MIQEFAKFLKEFNVIALAVAFIMGTAAISLINSLVKDILMPIIGLLMPTASWKDAIFHIGSANIGYGSFIAEFLNFLILSTIVFFIVKKLLKIESKQ